MSGKFYRIHTDRTETVHSFENIYSGPVESSCWLLGGGPSLNESDLQAISQSPIPVMTINLAGSHLIRPQFWTSYDPSARFHRSIYLDPGIMKLVHRRRSMDIVPDSTYKVCDCPNTFFFDRDQDRGFADFLSPSNEGVVDWADSMVQSIDLLYQLGFRKIYLAGCEMKIHPTREQIDLAREHGVECQGNSLLSDFLTACHKVGLSNEKLEEVSSCEIYHFDESKSLQASANTEQHYFRVSQYLRLSRRSMAIAGMQLISVTPGSRLNDYFPFFSVENVIKEIHGRVGDPLKEPVRGQYHVKGPRLPEGTGPMRDFRPHNWPVDRVKKNNDANGENKIFQGKMNRDDDDIPEEEILIEQNENGHQPDRIRVRSRVEILNELRELKEHRGEIDEMG